MLSGFYTAASGILQQERTINVLTNNVANAKTPGFRASRVVSTTFEHEFLTRIENYNTSEIGKGAPIRVVSDVPVNFESSSLEETGRPYDIAINGAGFFEIRGDDGQTYLTRNGNFDIDAEGYLILRGGGMVQGQSGDIQLENSEFLISEEGLIYRFDEDNEVDEIDTLSIVVAQEGSAVRLGENGLYTSEGQNVAVENISVIQGWTERNNIDIGHEYTLVMEAQRAFQACSSALQIVDRLNQKAATQIASL